MSTRMIPPSDDDGLGPIVESFLERLRRGERPSLTDLVVRHPDLAEQLRELIPALVEMEHLGGWTGPFNRPETRRTGRTDVGGEGPLPERLGDYRILRRIEGGGMGVVYEAERESLKSRVALKVMLPRFRADPKYLRRFHREARSAASLHHTNIVSVFDYGEHDGILYYVMQFIDGQPLHRVLDDVRQLRAERSMPESPNPTRTAAEGLLTGRFASPDGAAQRPDDTVAATVTFGTPPDPAADGPSADAPPSPGSVSLGSEDGDRRYYREVARICAQAADALDYAHRRGVLHRDIKPSNLLLDALGNIWVTDFGLAKLEGTEDLSQPHDVVGTLCYIPPERFRGESEPRGDVYALGATMYELLTLQPAFDGKDRFELIERISHQPPKPPRELDRQIPRDLERIVLKAIAKDPKDRFKDAKALGDELQRFLDGRPLTIRAVPAYERFWRWCKRNPGLAAANITAAALTTLLAIVSTVYAWTYRAQRDEIAGQRDEIRRAENQTRLQLFEALHDRARAGRLSRQMGQRFNSLDALERAARIGHYLKLPPKRLDLLRDEAIACLALPDLKPAGRAIPISPGVYLAAFDPTMTRYALRFKDGTILVRRLEDDHEVARFHARGDREFELFFSPDGRYLATTHYPDNALTVWDIDRRAIMLNDPGPVRNAAGFSPDSHRFALAHPDGDVIVYDLATGQPSRGWRGPGPRPGALAFRPDGAQIAVLYASKSPTCQILDTETGRLVRSITLPTTAMASVAWSPDGTTLATPCLGRKIYLWDAATGIRKATLEGHTNDGLITGFHPAGTLLASNGWEGRLWLWDPVLGRPWLNWPGVDGSHGWNFPSHDGRVVLVREDQWITYQIDPALEYRTLAHLASQRIKYDAPSISPDGRVLAVGTSPGVVLWHLARGMELAPLPIGEVRHLMFESSGDLLTSGAAGVLRWPIRLDPDRNEFRIGPPQHLPLPAAFDGIAEDHSGRNVALAGYTTCFVLTPQGPFQVGPLDDCRYVAISPDGQWLATGSHGKNGFQVWRLRDGSAEQVAHPVTEGMGGVRFSPDGKWLMTWNSPCRLWEVGTWREARRIGGIGLCFAPDGRSLVVQDANKVIRLVETETGRTLARFESPDLCTVGWATFSPDGARLVVTTNDGPAVHVWDLRAIRRRLARMGLDWDAPAYSDDDPADSSALSLPPLKVDYGPLAGHLEHFTESPQSLSERYTARLQKDPHDADAYHHRAHALANLRRFQEAIADLTQASRLRPDDAHLREMLALSCNNRAWEMATGPESHRDLARALKLVERAVELTPGRGVSLNTLGVVQYRLGRYTEAIATLQRSLAAGHGQVDGFDLFFLAMAHHRLGHRDEAKSCFHRAVHWVSEQKNLHEQYAKELAAFRAEAEAILAGPSGELPADVFAPAR